MVNILFFSFSCFSARLLIFFFDFFFFATFEDRGFAFYFGELSGIETLFFRERASFVFLHLSVRVIK